MNRQLYILGFLLLVAGGFLLVRGVDFPGFTLFVVGLFTALFGFAVPEDRTRTAFKALGASTLTMCIMYIIGYAWMVVANLSNPPNVHATMATPAIIPVSTIFILLTCIYYSVFYFIEKRHKP
jgi:uncharacterized membrane protein